MDWRQQLANATEILISMKVLPHEECLGLPEWYENLGMLIYRGQVVRLVSRQARNVRTVLSAFQESGWPPQIDDPLPDGKNPVRLNETVKSLNEHLILIRFRADGNGSGYRWEPTNAE